MNVEHITELTLEEARDTDGGVLPVGPIMFPVAVVKWVLDQFNK